MEHISQETRSHFLQEMDKMKPNKGLLSRQLRKMADRAEDAFDKIWLKHQKGEVTFEQWKEALNKWLTIEKIT